METMPPVILGVTLLLPFALSLVLHRPLESRYILTAPHIRQAMLQFYLEMALVLLAGVLAGTANLVFQGFPISSGLTLVLGCMIIGFFLALDMSLARERTVIKAAIVESPLVTPPQRLYPMTRKFTLVAFGAALFVTIVVGLVVTRDFFWLGKLEVSASATEAAKTAVIFEVFFIMAILLVYVANLILSYSKNLKLLFGNETDILERVSSGDLSKLVPVATHDEFGVIAGHTNTMIQGLRHRIQLLTAMKLAEEVQQSLLPKKPPEIKGLNIAGTSKYCDQTGGDYYDYFRLSDDRLGVVVADVSGHGVGAALNMIMARAFMHLCVREYQGAPQLLDTVNRFLTRDSFETGQFITVFFLEIDSANKTFKWVRAGHDPAILYDSLRGSFEELTGEGTALGVVEELTFRENVRQGWNPGSVLVIGTDGIWEARNQQDEMFGKERYLDVIRNHAADSAHGIQNAVIRAVESFQGDASQEDDITLVVVKLF